jgi:hypothetical protein
MPIAVLKVTGVDHARSEMQITENSNERRHRHWLLHLRAASLSNIELILHVDGIHACLGIHSNAIKRICLHEFVGHQISSDAYRNRTSV